jgi:hypothetical protein
MAEPTITFKGVEISDSGERKFSYSVIEVTRTCNLSGRARFFFRVST